MKNVTHYWSLASRPPALTVCVYTIAVQNSGALCICIAYSSFFHHSVFASRCAASSGDCPIGWEHSGCASACPTTCEDYLQPQLKVCADVCGSCECPQGMVVFRDRCVDPLECYTLMTGM